MLDFGPFIPSFLKIAILLSGVALFFWLAVTVLRAILRRGTHLPYAFQKTILLVGLPKELSKDDEKKEIDKE